MLQGDVDVLKVKKIFEAGERAKEEICTAIDIAVAVKSGQSILDSVICDALKTLDGELPKDHPIRPFVGLPYFHRYKRAPNNTALFLNWIEKKKEFDIEDFVKEYSCITEEGAIKIVKHQILKDRILQLSNTKFRVVQPKKEEKDT